MEAEWQEVTRIPLPPPGPHATPTAPTCLTFDTVQELLWAGNDYGRITSFHGTELQRYTSYYGHFREGPVKQILSCEKGIISISGRSIHFAHRKGLAQWHTSLSNTPLLLHTLEQWKQLPCEQVNANATLDRCNDFQDLRCMTFLSKDCTELLVAGCQATMFRVHVEKGEIVETIPTQDHYTILKRGGQYICAATSTGSVQLFDPKLFSVLKSWKAHLGWISDMDANSTFLVTCGWSPRQQYSNMLDPLAKVFDLKTLMPLPPVPFHAGAAYIRMHPRMLTTAIIASQSGQVQMLDIMSSSMINVHLVSLLESFLQTLEISTSGEALAVSDSLSWIHLRGSPSRMHFTDFSNPVELADAVVPKSVSLDWSDGRPLSSVGLPYYKDVLFSAWPSHLIFEVGAPPAKIDQAILLSLNRSEYGAYARNPKKSRRNQIENTRAADHDMGAMEGPKFLSERAKDGDAASENEPSRCISDVLSAFNATHLEGSIKLEVPVMYRNVEIKYSKFGVDDFDFEYYNRTRFSGLETHIANSYANPLLQVLKFTPVIRNLALQHTASKCLYDSCLLCEMGFLFDMLEKANGQNCQATNFLKTFSSLPNASSLGLLEENTTVRPLALMIQSMNRFLLEKIAADFRIISPQASQMDQALTTVAINNIRCAHCNNETVRGGATYVHELVYPSNSPNKTHVRTHGPSFSMILKASIERQDQSRGWCDRCKRYQQLGARKTIKTLPSVLVVNTAIHTGQAKQLWTQPRWLPQEIGIIVEQGQLFCYEGQDLKIHLHRGAYRILVYELVGFVADIDAGEKQKSHLVSMINVSPSMRDKQAENAWHLFNDFLVRKVTADEALRFDASWKLPAILTYQIKSSRHLIDETWKDNLDTSLLYKKFPATQFDDPHRFRTLDFPSERPSPGTAVGIDAEFVSLEQEELEIKADGSRSVLRPSRLGLARVSVLRSGEAEPDRKDPTDYRAMECTTSSYVPFIDDYIHITDPVIDYLTPYSGISQGDLDPRSSPHAPTGRLVSLRTAYKKIWLLLNLGVIFVGHGLLKDFRTINIHIPKKQVIDTVDLFFIKSRQRKLSLRFLSWLLLGVEIQGGMHDSVEDARTALRLWEVWKGFEKRGPEYVERKLEDIYRKGRELGYRPPVKMEEGVATGRTTPAMLTVGDAEAPEGRNAPSTPAGRAAGLVSVQAAVDPGGK